MPAFAKKQQQQARRSPGKTAELSGDTIAPGSSGEGLTGMTGMTGLTGVQMQSKRLEPELEKGIQSITCVQPPLDLSLNLGQLCMAKIITACLSGNAKDVVSCFHPGYTLIFNNLPNTDINFASLEVWQAMLNKVSMVRLGSMMSSATSLANQLHSFHWLSKLLTFDQWQLEFLTFRADNMVEVCPGHIFQHTTLVLKRKETGETREAHFGDGIVFNTKGQLVLWTRIGDTSFHDFVRESVQP